MRNKRSGIIYDLGEGRYGLAIHSEQHRDFGERIYMHVFLDPLCTIPELDPKSGKKYVTLKHSTLIIQIGFSD